MILSLSTTLFPITLFYYLSFHRLLSSLSHTIPSSLSHTVSSISFHGFGLLIPSGSDRSLSFAEPSGPMLPPFRPSRLRFRPLRSASVRAVLADSVFVQFASVGSGFVRFASVGTGRFRIRLSYPRRLNDA